MRRCRRCCISGGIPIGGNRRGNEGDCLGSPFIMGKYKFFRYAGQGHKVSRGRGIVLDFKGIMYNNKSMNNFIVKK